MPKTRRTQELTPAQHKARNERIAAAQEERRTLRVEAQVTAKASRRRRDLGRLQRTPRLSEEQKRQRDDLAVAVAADERGAAGDTDTKETSEP